MGKSCKKYGFDKRNLTKYYLENLKCRDLFRDKILKENIYYEY